MIGRVFSLYHADNQILLNQSHSSRSWHSSSTFPQTFTSLVPNEVPRVNKYKWFESEKQKCFWQQRWTRNENIITPDQGDLIILEKDLGVGNLLVSVLLTCVLKAITHYDTALLRLLHSLNLVTVSGLWNMVLLTGLNIDQGIPKTAI